MPLTDMQADSWWASTGQTTTITTPSSRLTVSQHYALSAGRYRRKKVSEFVQRRAAIGYDRGSGCVELVMWL